MKAVVSISLGLVFVGLATLNVITILESSRSGQDSADTRSSNSTSPRWRLSLHRPIRADGLVHEQASYWLARRNLRRRRRTRRPSHFAGSTSLREGNDRAQVQKPSFGFDAAWIVDLCHLRRARTHPCAPVRIGENQSFNFDCEILADTYCLVLRFYGPFSITPARLFADESSNTLHYLPNRYRNRAPTLSLLNLSAAKCRRPMPKRFVFAFKRVSS